VIAGAGRPITDRRCPSGSIPALVDRVVSALMVDRQWIMIKTDFLLHAARSREVAAVLAAHHDELREALAAHLSTVVDVGGLPNALRTPDGSRVRSAPSTTVPCSVCSSTRREGVCATGSGCCSSPCSTIPRMAGPLPSADPPLGAGPDERTDHPLGRSLGDRSGGTGQRAPSSMSTC